MKSTLLFRKYAFLVLALLAFAGCNKEENYPGVVNAVYISSTAVTGTATGSQTTITNTASGKVSVTPATARVYVNTLKSFEVAVTYTLSGTAVAGTNYTTPAVTTVTIPAGKWYADISIPVINAALSGNKTIIITMTAASNNVQVGIGTDRNYKVFTYTLTN